MADDIRVAHAERFAQVARDLKKASKAVQKESYAALEKAVKPLKDAARKSAQENLPKRGGLADHVAAMKIRTQRRVNAKQIRLSLIASVDSVQEKNRKTAIRKEKARQRRADRAYEKAVRAEEG